MENEEFLTELVQIPSPSGHEAEIQKKVASVCRTICR